MKQSGIHNIVVVLIFGLWLVCSFIFMVLLDNGVHALLLACLVILCCVPWLLWRREPNLFVPVYFTSIFLTLIYPVRILTLLLFPEYSVTYIPPPYDPGLVTKGLLYIITGIIIYLFFFYNPPKLLLHLPFKNLSLESSIKHWPKKILLIYLVGWAVRIYQIGTKNYLTFLTGEGHDPTTYTLLSYFAELSVIAYILAWIYWIKRGKHNVKSLLILLAIAVPEAMYALTIQGAKTHLVRLILFPIMAYWLIRKRLPAKIIVPAVAFTVLFVFPYIQTYRDIYIERFGGYLEVSLQEGFSITREAVAEMYSRPGHYDEALPADTPFLLRNVVIFINRWAGFDGLVAVLTNVPERFEFVYGKDLLLIPFALIPRAIWPDKPVSDVQSIFDQQITMAAGSSTSPYPIAEGYFNGGLVGVILVMFTLAIIQRLLYSGFFLPRGENPLITAAYIWLFIWVTEIGTWVLPIYVSLVQRIAILALVCMFFTSKQSFPIRALPHGSPHNP